MPCYSRAVSAYPPHLAGCHEVYVRRQAAIQAHLHCAHVLRPESDRSFTRPVKRRLHVEQQTQGVKCGSPDGGARTVPADLTRHPMCVHPDEPRHAHSRTGGSVAPPLSRQNRPCVSSDAPPLMCATRARARDCTSGSESRSARASPAQTALWPEVQCAIWHGREQ